MQTTATTITPAAAPHLTPEQELWLMQDFRAAYSLLANGGWGTDSHLKPELERKRRCAALRQWLLEIAEEYGRMVTEEEAFTALYGPTR